MTAGIGDLIHRVQKRRNEDRALTRVDLASLEIHLDILADKADLSAIRKRKEGVRKIFGHIIVRRRRNGVIITDQIADLFLIVFLCAKPRDMADMIEIKKIVRDDLFIGKSRCHGARPRENIGNRRHVGAFRRHGLTNEIQKLVFISEITSVADVHSLVRCLRLNGRIARAQLFLQLTEKLLVPDITSLFVHGNGDQIIFQQIVKRGAAQMQLLQNLR